MWRSWCRDFRWIRNHLHGDLIGLVCHAVSQAGAEFPEYRWSWSLAAQGPRLFSVTNDNVGRHISTYCGATGVICDREQAFWDQFQCFVSGSLSEKNRRERSVTLSVLLEALFLLSLLLKLPSLLTD